MTLVPWTGDYEDEMFAVIGDYHAHVECMDDGTPDPDDPDDEGGGQSWFAQVWKEVPHLGGVENRLLFHNFEEGIHFISIDIARKFCEFFIYAHEKGVAWQKGQLCGGRNNE